MPGQKEVDVVGFAIRSFHIYAGKVLAPAEVLQAIIMYFYQVQSEILPFVLDAKFPVGALFALSIDILPYAGGNISRAHLFLGPTLLRLFRALLWRLGAFLRMFWMFLREYCRSRCEKQRHR